MQRDLFGRPRHTAWIREQAVRKHVQLLLDKSDRVNNIEEAAQPGCRRANALISQGRAASSPCVGMEGRRDCVLSHCSRVPRARPMQGLDAPVPQREL